MTSAIEACSFCGRKVTDGARLVSGPAVYICELCWKSAGEVFASQPVVPAPEVLVEVAPWSEEVWYVECPHCQHTVELGSDVIWDKGAREECMSCSRTFVLMEQGA